jgi:activator of 2-hydroxyglutaryl-CoA dehydratase
MNKMDTNQSRLEFEIKKIEKEIQELKSDSKVVKSDICKVFISSEIKSLENRKDRKEFLLWKKNKEE